MTTWENQIRLLGKVKVISMTDVTDVTAVALA